MQEQQQEPMWLTIARREIGVHEVEGAGNNPTIVGWAERLGGWIAEYYTADSIPWCGLFVGYCMEQAAQHTPGDASLRALEWASWGQSCAPQIGAVLVFQRPGGGHVGFYVAEDLYSYHVLGGNQSDSVCIERISKTRCVAVRWPEGAAPVGAAVQVAAQGVPLSTNEA